MSEIKEIKLEELDITKPNIRSRAIDIINKYHR